jgi:uncharacterized phage protein (TIGR02218 family)
MRRIHPDLQARLNSGATRLCRAWRVRRIDGVAFGFTDHDGDIAFDGTVFRAGTGLDASAVQASTGLSVDNAEAMGALSDAGVREEDVQAGRFDDAAVEHWLVDWERTDLRVLLFKGHFGEIRRIDGAFEVELRGLAERLNLPVGRTLQRSCDRRLGDAKCRFDLSRSGYSAEGAVSSVASSEFEAEGIGTFAERWFAGGVLTWTSGRNAPTASAVKADAAVGGDGRRLTLWRSPGFPITVGDRFRVVAGCDRSAETCREKFRNFLNFRGFPDIPGEDWVAAYPKGGEVHDGSSRRRG